jgi:hypothetical protein
MRAFIQIRDGAPFEHPIFEDNFRAAFPDVDLNNLPDGFAEFFLIASPDLTYAVLNKEHPSYVRSGNGYTWAWDITPMTATQITEKQNQTRTQWINSGGPNDWVLDVVKCRMIPPTPVPNDGKEYRWDFNNKIWVEVV